LGAEQASGYRRIFVPVDNSDHSNAAVDVAVRLAAAAEAELTGCHVYAARMHDVRFKQMEYTLPDEYQQEQELDRQRRIHDSLITRGLQLISDSYLDVMKERTDAAGLPMTYKTMDGKNWECLVEDIAASDYDLVVMGALGMGAVKDSQLGSVTERVARRVRVDLLVVRDTHPFAPSAADRILVGVDGSPESFAGLRTAIELARVFGKRVEAVAVYDPYLHYAVFNGIVDVLSAEASKVFRFREQEQLHEEIIDTGLAKIYQSHLRVAESLARDEGVELTATLLDGKAFKKILQHARQDPPWLLVLGRIGVHSGPEMDVGSNSENLLRMAPCSVLLSSRTYVPPVDLQAEASVSWTGEAEQRMERVPAHFRGVARTAVCRWAMERGHSVISSELIDQAIGDIMPAHAARALGADGGRAVERGMADGSERATWICRRCGRAARGERPVRCPVCGESEFGGIDKAAIEAAARRERVQEEAAFDGFKVRWTVEAKEQVLARVPKGYERRRVKAIIEKRARTQGVPSITREFAEANLDDAYAPLKEVYAPAAAAAEAAAPDREIAWTDEAVVRLERVPAGFMRSLAKAKVEAYAAKILADRITLDVAEGGLAEARELMGQMKAAYGPEADQAFARAHGAVPGGPGLPKAPAPGWTEDGVRRLHEVEVRAAEKFDPARARELAEHAAESRAQRTAEAINAAYLSKLGLKLGYGHPLSESTYRHKFTWSPEAEARLLEVPEFCREMARWRVEWTAVKKGLGDVITPEAMDVKFDLWGEVSEHMQAGGRSLPWDEDAERRIARVPDFVRGQVIQAIEGNAREQGQERVTSAVMDAVIEKWIATGDFHEGRWGFKA
jgi:nucleotide-binding universal stress UspA family protein/ribosomal protein L37E